jgi:hypothetical protein
MTDVTHPKTSLAIDRESSTLALNHGTLTVTIFLTLDQTLS